MYTNKLFESYNKQLNEKINKDNIDINKAIANPNLGKNQDRIKQAGYDVEYDGDLIKNPKTGKQVWPKDYSREEKKKVDFKGKLDSERKNLRKTRRSAWDQKDNRIPKSARIGGDKHNPVFNSDEVEPYSPVSYDTPKKSISKNINNYKKAVSDREEQLDRANSYDKDVTYYEKKAKEANDTVDRYKKYASDARSASTAAESKRKAIIDNIRKRKTESEHLNEDSNIDYDEKLKAIYNSYKLDGMEEAFWSDLMNCVDNYEYIDEWYSSLDESAKTKLEEVYSERYGGDPQDFIGDVISIKAKLEELNLDGFGSHLAQQMVEEFIETCDSQISMTKGKIEAGDFKDSEE